MDPLIGALPTWSGLLVRKAAEALAQIGDPRAIDPLVIWLRRGNQDAGAAIRRMGDSAVLGRILS